MSRERVASVAAAISCVVSCICAAPTSMAQSVPGPLSFEVASIKPIQAPPRTGVQALPGGRLNATSTLRNLVMYAYDVKDYQISEGPGWTRSDYFTIVASADDARNPSPEEMRQMLQALLSERFELRLRRENKEMAVYLLVPSRNGPKLKESAAGGRFSLTASVGRLRATNLSMARLAQTLSASVGRPVIDRTGLAGEYDVSLEGSGVGMTPRPGAGSTEDSGASSVFTAIQEQLGLKLDSAKEPVEFLTIEHVEKPSGN